MKQGTIVYQVMCPDCRIPLGIPRGPSFGEGTCHGCGERVAYNTVSMYGDPVRGNPVGAPESNLGQD